MRVVSLMAVVFLSLLIAKTAAAFEPAHSVAASILDENPSTLLFEVAADKPTYLYASPHNTTDKIRSYVIDTPMEYLQSSDVVFCETSFKDINEFQRLVQQYDKDEWTGDKETEEKIVGFRNSCYFPDGQNLLTHCDERLRKKIELFYGNHDKEQRLQSVLRRRVKPLVIAVADLHNIMPEEPTFVADHVLMRAAIKQGIPLKSLDDYPEVHVKLGALAIEHQLEYVEYLLDLRALDDDRHFKNIIKACGSGKINDIYKLFEAIILPQDSKSTWRDQLSRELWDHRNNAWMEKLIPYVGKSTNFVVVGATHLGGSVGLIRLFEEKGFNVRPMQMKVR